MPKQPTDYDNVAPCPPKAKFPWAIVGTAMAVPMGSMLIWGGMLTANYTALAQDVAANGAAISTTPTTFVPRGEINAKLETLDLKVSTVQATVDANAEQSERQTAQIIRRIERIGQPQ